MVAGKVIPAVVTVIIREAVLVIFSEFLPNSVLGSWDIKLNIKSSPVLRKHAQRGGKGQTSGYLSVQEEVASTPRCAQVAGVA